MLIGYHPSINNSTRVIDMYSYPELTAQNGSAGFSWQEATEDSSV